MILSDSQRQRLADSIGDTLLDKGYKDSDYNSFTSTKEYFAEVYAEKIVEIEEEYGEEVCGSEYDKVFSLIDFGGMDDVIMEDLQQEQEDYDYWRNGY